MKYQDNHPNRYYHVPTLEHFLERSYVFIGRFDPQVFHTDPEAAKRTIFEGLIASGRHTAGMTMRLFVVHYL